jgi:hypothetical protein
MRAPDVVRPGAVRAALEAWCVVDVVGTGVVDIEEDYLPHVVACENGAADLEALRAQAVAARSYVYYRLDTGDGTITDGQGDQVYSCNNTPGPEHYEAVASTAGEVLAYEDTLVAAFYVAGAIPTADDCIAEAGDDDYSSTEHFVTYNWGATGFADDGVHLQTTLGWVNEGNWANRGCQSQNGAHCLAEKGWGYEDILRFYYGMDIDHAVAQGECVRPSGLAHSCGEILDEDVAVFDDGGTCFRSGCATGREWGDRDVGVDGSATVVATRNSEDADCSGRWELSFAAAGDYLVEVHIPDVPERAGAVDYRVRHAGADAVVSLNQSATSGWASLGTFRFDVGALQYVELTDTAAENGVLAEGPVVV